jgi:glycosyltransferase involved in cell wall biosynthesis
MKWFYDQLDLVFVNSQSYRAAWIDRGIAAEKFRILPRGLDTALFHPSRRENAYWMQRGIPKGTTVLLYVGRISKEKDLDVIVTAWRKLRGPDRALVFVGDGPHLAELRGLAPDAVFTGTLAGLELARAFAAADIFLFPSTTDTFGNVVLEALASGLPVVVSDRGGPKDLIEHEVTGFVTRALDADDFCNAVERLLVEPELRRTMSAAAHRAVQNRDWKEAGRTFWSMSPE